MAKWIEQLEATPEDRRLLEQERVLFEAGESICAVMEVQNVSRNELAQRLGCSPAFITKLLRGSNNFTLRTLADVYSALDWSVHLVAKPLGEQIRLPLSDFTCANWALESSLREWADMIAVCSSSEEDESRHPHLSARDDSVNTGYDMAA